jgi:hypothetical protein
VGAESSGRDLAMSQPHTCDRSLALPLAEVAGDLALPFFEKGVVSRPSTTSHPSPKRTLPSRPPSPPDPRSRWFTDHEGGTRLDTGGGIDSNGRIHEQLAEFGHSRRGPVESATR